MINFYTLVFCAIMRFIFQKYNQRIRELKEDMEEAAHAAELVRKEIVSFRNRAAIVTIDNTCESCDVTLLIRPFYLFPCGHKFHADCLQAEIMPCLGCYFSI